MIFLQARPNHTIPTLSGWTLNPLCGFLHGFGVCPFVCKIDSAVDVGFDGASEMFYVLDDDVSQGHGRIIPMQSVQ